MLSENMLSAEQRIAILKDLPGNNIQLHCVDDVLSTLFFANASMPLANPAVAVSSALSFYWRTLDHASRIFSPSEWSALAAPRSLFLDSRYWDMSVASAVELALEEHAGDDWCDDVLATKVLLPKIADLSETDFAAVIQILRYIAGLSCDDPFAAMALKLPALASVQPAPRT